MGRHRGWRGQEEHVQPSGRWRACLSAVFQHERLPSFRECDGDEHYWTVAGISPASDFHIPVFVPWKIPSWTMQSPAMTSLVMVVLASGNAENHDRFYCFPASRPRSSLRPLGLGTVRTTLGSSKAASASASWALNAALPRPLTAATPGPW